MNTFELTTHNEPQSPAIRTSYEGLNNTVLLNNARWFARIRWFIILLLCLAGISGQLIPGVISSIDLTPPRLWPWVLAGILIIANIVFVTSAKTLQSTSPRKYIETNIWLQIILDLAVITLLVHIVGSTQTFISLTYLFHVALACIFFPARRSLLVTILASIFYLTCVALEISGIWPPECIFISAVQAQHSDNIPALMAVSGVIIWFILWYLVSTLSEFVRERDIQLVHADKEKNRLMLQTTHDLKAPFSGIENNIQMLRLKHWNEMSPEVQDIIGKIETRSETLRERIRNILLLGELRSQPAGAMEYEAVSLKPIVESVVEELSEEAAERKITVNVDVPQITVVSKPKELQVLFLNLISNAISYSYESGSVNITAREQADGVHLSVSDHGIGIKPEAISRIFDEFFRTREAAEFNKVSTGLGLSIVKQVAQNLNLRIKVDSIEKQGTTFEVIIPAGKA